MGWWGSGWWGCLWGGGSRQTGARLDEQDAAWLLRELAWLRKRAGFTAAHLAGALLVDEALRASLEDSSERLRHRSVSAIYSLEEDDGQLPQVLLDAYGLSRAMAGCGGLLQRRRLAADRLECSMETVAHREEAGMRLLHARLVAGRYGRSVGAGGA